jgi:hypothetical protein
MVPNGATEQILMLPQRSGLQMEYLLAAWT